VAGLGSSLPRAPVAGSPGKSDSTLSIPRRTGTIPLGLWWPNQLGNLYGTAARGHLWTPAVSSKPRRNFSGQMDADRPSTFSWRGRYRRLCSRPSRIRFRRHSLWISLFGGTRIWDTAVKNHTKCRRALGLQRLVLTSHGRAWKRPSTSPDPYRSLVNPLWRLGGATRESVQNLSSPMERGRNRGLTTR